MAGAGMTMDALRARWAPEGRNRWIWLAYLPLYFAPAIWFPLGPTQMAVALAALTVAAMLYLVSGRVSGPTRLALIAAMLGLSFALSFNGGLWPVVAIYATAMAGEERPSGRAMALIGVLVGAMALFGWWSGQPFIFWVPAMVLMFMVGFANVASTALEDKNRALMAARDEVRRLAATSERERIGRDLHDLLGRTLTLVAIKADLAAKLAPRDAGRAEAEMREVADAARAALAEVRAAVSGMTGASLPREIEASRTAMIAAAMSFTVEGDPARVDGETGAVLAMVLREGVTNVIRHSGAQNCRVTIMSDEQAEWLVVEDDGTGDAALAAQGGGLAGLRKRLAAAGGALSVESGTSGTRLVATLPRAGGEAGA